MHTSVPGTFQLDNVRSFGEEPYVLDGTVFGLKNPSSTYVLAARLFNDSLIHLQPGEKLVVLQLVDLSGEPHWLNIEKSGIVLSEKEATKFKFSKRFNLL